jgi:hypothetical protein
MFSRSEFPLTADYVDQLPDGLASLPDCRVRAAVFDAIWRDFPELGRRELPQPLSDLLRGKVPANAWISEVVGQVANLMVRDVGVKTDDEFLSWTHEVSRALFDKPVLRHLMKMMSPALVVMGAAKRWSAVHQGSTLEAAPVRTSGPRATTVGRLTYPAGLFPPLFFRGLTTAFEAALMGARGRAVQVELASVDVTAAEYLVSWQV